MSRVSPLLTWLALPVYVWQGVGVRLRTERMRPADGPTEGQVEGAEPALSLLVLGDSSAASVGVEHTGDGVAFHLAHLMAAQTGRAVKWRSAGFSSAVSDQLRDFVVPNLAPDAWSHIVLMVGTNDTKNFHTISRFKKAFGGLLYALRAKWPGVRIVWSPVAEFALMPALPKMLGRILEARAVAMNRLGGRLCHERGAVPATRLPVTDPKAGFSSDGFHASAAGYRAWAEHLLPFILDDQRP